MAIGISAEGVFFQKDAPGLNPASRQHRVRCYRDVPAEAENCLHSSFNG